MGDNSGKVLARVPGRRGRPAVRRARGFSKEGHVTARFTERRAAPRVGVQVAAHVVCPGIEEAIVVQTRDICRFGLLCRVPRYIAPSTQLDIAMILPLREGGRLRNELLELSGLVVRTEPQREQPGAQGYDMGIYFARPTDQARSLIDRYMCERSGGQPQR